MKKCKFFVLLYKNKNIVMATIKKTTAKKTTVKSNAKSTKTIKEPQRISKTGLAFREAIKNPWFTIVDKRAVLK